MAALSLEHVCRLLGTSELPGSKKELEVLRMRIGELLALNGEDWIRANRSMLLEQWRCVVDLKTVR
jgi:hypothetical protein